MWLSVAGQRLGGEERIGLLRAIAEQGSITHAAKAFGMSYKGAWDAIDAMNTLSGTPLVERVTGGKGGGFTRLTEHGQRLVERFEQVDAVHQRFLQLLDESAMDLTQEFSMLQALNLKTSARNQWLGSIAALRAGAVNDEVEVLLPGGTRLHAIVTRESTESLGLRVKQPVLVLAKSSAVLLATQLEGVKFAAGNRLDGRVLRVTPGAVNAEVLLETEAGVQVVAVVPQSAVQELGLAPGAQATALLKASDLIIASIR